MKKSAIEWQRHYCLVTVSCVRQKKKKKGCNKKFMLSTISTRKITSKQIWFADVFAGYTDLLHFYGGTGIRKYQSKDMLVGLTDDSKLVIKCECECESICVSSVLHQWAVQGLCSPPLAFAATLWYMGHLLVANTFIWQAKGCWVNSSQRHKSSSGLHLV